MPTQKITKSEIIERAAHIFRKQGYNKTTINDIGEACGLLKGSIYHYFKSKEDLMLAVLTTASEKVAEHIYPIARDRRLPPRQRLEKIMEMILTGMFCNGTDDGGCLFGSIGLETSLFFPDFNEVIKNNFNASFDAFADVYRERHDDQKARELAEQAHVDMQGAMVLSIIYKDVSIYERAKQRIIDYIDQD